MKIIVDREIFYRMVQESLALAAPGLVKGLHVTEIIAPDRYATHKGFEIEFESLAEQAAKEIG